MGEGDKLAGSLRGGWSPFSVAPFSLGLPARTLSPNGTPSNRAEPGLAGSLPLILPPVGCGERDRSPNVVGFEFAICSKCERREDTGFYSRAVSGARSDRFTMIEHTMDEPSRLSSGDSSILKAADTSKAYMTTS